MPSPPDGIIHMPSPPDGIIHMLERDIRFGVFRVHVLWFEWYVVVGSFGGVGKRVKR